MEKQVIWRGILAGALAGVLAFVWARIFVQPVIDRAIDYEDGVGAAREALHSAAEHAHQHGHSHGEEGAAITRAVQANIGMGLGLLGFSVAMAALLAIVFCVLYGRAQLSARVLSVLIAGGMFVALWLVPALKYPPNPPAVSLDETINQRTLLYLLLVALSAVLFAAAVYLGSRLAPKLGAWNATLAGAAGYLVAVAIVMLILPTIDETPGPIVDAAGTIVFDGFPADDLYEFRLFSLGTQIVMWAAIGLVFAALVSRLLEGKRQQSTVGGTSA